MKTTLAMINRNIMRFRPDSAKEARKIAKATTGANNLNIEIVPVYYYGYMQGVRIKVSNTRINAAAHLLPDNKKVYSIFKD